MVRKTTAQVKKTTTNTSDQDNNIDISAFMNNAWKGIQENWMTLLGFLLVLLGLIQLRELILGIILLTSGILLISGFFGEKDK